MFKKIFFLLLIISFLKINSKSYCFEQFLAEIRKKPELHYNIYAYDKIKDDDEYEFRMDLKKGDILFCCLLCSHQLKINFPCSKSEEYLKKLERHLKLHKDKNHKLYDKNLEVEDKFELAQNMKTEDIEALSSDKKEQERTD